MQILTIRSKRGSLALVNPSRPIFSCALLPCWKLVCVKSIKDQALIERSPPRFVWIAPRCGMALLFAQVVVTSVLNPPTRRGGHRDPWVWPSPLVGENLPVQSALCVMCYDGLGPRSVTFHFSRQTGLNGALLVLDPHNKGQQIQSGLYCSLTCGGPRRLTGGAPLPVVEFAAMNPLCLLTWLTLLLWWRLPTINLRPFCCKRPRTRQRVRGNLDNLNDLLPS